MKRFFKNLVGFSGFPLLLFVFLTFLLLSTALGFNHYRTSYVYVVSLDDVELGVVAEAKDIQKFVDHLVRRCGDLYGLEIQLKEQLVLSREFRAHSTPDLDEIRDIIRQEVSFITNAYLINVDGKPFIPVAEKVVLDEVVDSLLDLYTETAGLESSGAEVIEATIVEELQLEECVVSPDSLFTRDEIVTLLINNNISTPARQPEGPSTIPGQQSILSGRYADAHLSLRNLASDASEIVISVRTVEAVTVIESIPFPVEYVDDNTKYVNQSEITSPGKDGEKEVVYHLVRDNGVEIERIVIEEIIIEEPETQIESVGRKELAAYGSSNFIWPVQGEGTIYPNQGFRPGHNGIDIHIAHGTNVLAADSGTVVYDGWGSTQGNYLILQHGSYWTLYLHNSAHLVKQGDRVTRGQAIAKVGATGRATGSHLHFEVRVDDGTRQWNSYYQHQPVDPMQFYLR